MLNECLHDFTCFISFVICFHCMSVIMHCQKLRNKTKSNNSYLFNFSKSYKYIQVPFINSQYLIESTIEANCQGGFWPRMTILSSVCQRCLSCIWNIPKQSYPFAPQGVKHIWNAYIFRIQLDSSNDLRIESKFNIICLWNISKKKYLSSCIANACGGYLHISPSWN